MIRRLSTASWPRLALPIAWTVVVVALSLWLRLLSPLALRLNEAYDDQLFARNGFSLLHTSWLGSFTNVTIAKGAAFPAFLAFLYVLQIPYLVGLQLLHLGAAGVTAFAIWRVTKSHIAALIGFTALALDPDFFGMPASLVLTDNWYASICLLLFSLAVIFSTTPQSQLENSWRSRLFLLGIGACFGLMLSTYWLGREERPWLLPTLALVFVAAVLTRWRERRSQQNVGRSAFARAAFVTRLCAALIALGVFSGAVIGVSAENRSHYGVALTSDFLEGSFPYAMSEWQSVQAGTPRRLILLSEAQRQTVYRVSPAARELKPYLEGPVRAWIGESCKALHICNDYAAGWMPWAVRDALTLSGHFATESEAQRFLHQLGDEITASCASHRLQCGPSMPGMLPPLSNIHLSDFASWTWLNTQQLINWDLADRDNTITSGDATKWPLFAGVIRGLEPSLPEEQAGERQMLNAGNYNSLLKAIYSVGSRILLPLALLGYMLACIKRPRGMGLAIIIGLAVALAVLSRVLLLAFVFSNMIGVGWPGYSMPTSGFFITTVVIGMWLLVCNPVWRQLAVRWRTR